MSTPCTLLLQRLPHRAGAQTCLIRLLKQEVIQQLNPILITNNDGWLSQEAKKIGLKVIITKFPSARSFTAKIYKNYLFSKKIAHLLGDINCRPHYVIGNDYLENQHVLNLSKILGAKSITFIRSSGLSHHDYLKYKCHQTKLLLPIGDTLAKQIHFWGSNGLIKTSYDGLLPEEFKSTYSATSRRPRKILVIGTPNPEKGWTDVYQAVSELDQLQQLPPECQFYFTGEIPQEHQNSWRLSGIGRLNGLSEAFNQFDAVINPSRRESFGMATMEAVATGIPIISSNTGVARDIISDKNQIFTPGNIEELRQAILHLIQNYSTCHNVAKLAKDRLLRKFPASRQASELCDALSLLKSIPMHK